MKKTMGPATLLCGIILAACSFSAGASICLGAEYYVSTTGDDGTGTGTIANPYRTIQHVLDSVAASGDTLILREGTYEESVRVRASNITIRSRDGEWAVIQSPIDDEEAGVALTFDVDSDGGRLERVEVIGGYWYGIKLNTKWDWGDPDDRSGACNITVAECKIHDTGDACIKITPGCDDVTIRSCEIYNSGRNDLGIRSMSSGFPLSDNT